MPDQAGKLSSERNGGYTQPKGPYHPAEGQGVNPIGSGGDFTKLLEFAKFCIVLLNKRVPKHIDF